MVVYGTALVLGLPAERLAALACYDHRLLSTVPPRLHPAPVPLYEHDGGAMTPFPGWYWERMERMAEFSADLLKPTARVPQFGDNDSGRFLKLQPVYRKRTVREATARYENLDGYHELPSDDIFWDEEHLDHRPLIAAISGLTGRSELLRDIGAGWWETALVRSMVNQSPQAASRSAVRSSAAERVRVGTSTDWERSIRTIESLSADRRRRVELDIPGESPLRELTPCAYPAFGLYIFRSERLFLAVRCGPVGQNGFGGHAHSDQLAIELELDGVDIYRDPGTYLYTPLPELRNAYRTARVHFGPWFAGEEPARLDIGPFLLQKSPEGTCTYFGKQGFAGVARGKRYTAHCAIRITDSRITIWHGLAGSTRLCAIPIGSARGQIDLVCYSPGYGLQLRNDTGLSRATAL